ncbi:Kelch repeat-containing protein [Paenibacillus radicis (ex Xue et al. 2023)]|uniref:Fibronectin type-III domain-containing protein n=1 Tax=Paenibacillus radicis (ex Xue et al. 2023) TaxID=2972489 RepID=A0ABT1YK02_9BACL|nr:kelch repeat-containing protein [Paenibacillus radicis (ex Xue et al. 2023)]MCR8633514.1 hypothetical protein [Paenibacillus radicis (ex Xue et al. 2023)]
MIQKFGLVLFMILFLFLGATVTSASTISWEDKSPMQRAKFGIAQSTQVYDGKIYVIGGLVSLNSPVDDLEVYNPKNDSWTMKSSLPKPLWGAATSIFGGKIYTFGGSENEGNRTVNNVYEYDIQGNTWATKQPMALPRSEAGAVTYAGKIYVFGGQDLNGRTVYNTVDIYDPLSDSWSSGTPIPIGVYDFAIGIVNNKIYIIGGDKNEGGVQYTKNVQIYDPILNSWTSGTPLPSENSEMGYTSIGNKIYLSGGQDNLGLLSEYNTQDDSWSTLGSITPKRTLIASTNLNGDIYLIGGRTGRDTPTNFVQVYRNVPVTPINIVAIGGNSLIQVTWDGSTGATGYNVKRSTTIGGPYTTVASNVYGTSYTDTTVTNGTTYYYVVTALNSAGESANSNEALATPQGTVTPPTSNKALLVIILLNGLEKEYDLPMTDINNFISWYNGRAAGIGSEVYTINKNFNKAHFLNRKDYIAYDKIEFFEVNEYTLLP